MSKMFCIISALRNSNTLTILAFISYFFCRFTYCNISPFYLRKSKLKLFAYVGVGYFISSWSMITNKVSVYLWWQGHDRNYIFKSLKIFVVNEVSFEYKWLTSIIQRIWESWLNTIQYYYMKHYCMHYTYKRWFY